jgi:hypothetical protein
MASDSSIESIHTYLLKIGYDTDIYKDKYASSSDKKPYHKTNKVEDFISNTSNISKNSLGTKTSMIISNIIKEKIPSPDNIIYVALSNNLRRGVAEYIEEIDTERQLPSSYLSDIKKNNIKYYELYDEDVYKTTKTNTQLFSNGISERIQKNVFFIYHKDNTYDIQEPNNYIESNDNIYFYINIGSIVPRRKKTLGIFLRAVIVINTDFMDSDSDLSKSFSHYDSFKIDDSQTPPQQAAATKQEIIETFSVVNEDLLSDAEPDTSSDTLPDTSSETSSGIVITSKKTKPDDESPEIEKYVYNPKDIHALLKKYKITNKEKDEDPMNGDYLIGFPFGIQSKYRNIYKVVGKTDKYFLSGRLEQTPDSTDGGNIKWFTLL